VTRPDLYDPQINLAYGELAGFYGALIDPARARKPKDKPRVERPMPYVRGQLRLSQPVPPIELEAAYYAPHQRPAAG
jgi:hypothetical protein